MIAGDFERGYQQLWAAAAGGCGQLAEPRDRDDDDALLVRDAAR